MFRFRGEGCEAESPRKLISLMTRAARSGYNSVFVDDPSLFQLNNPRIAAPCQSYFTQVIAAARELKMMIVPSAIPSYGEGILRRVPEAYVGSVKVEDSRRYADLSNPKVHETWRQQMSEIRALFDRAKAGPGDLAFFMTFDEIRAGNTGQSLAGAAREGIQAIRSQFPNSRIIAWHDMFDPHGNAKSKYSKNRGDMRGSWEGIDSSVDILNWSYGETVKEAAQAGHGQNSYEFWKRRGNRQIIGGYFDHNWSWTGGVTDTQNFGQFRAYGQYESGASKAGTSAMYTAWEKGHGALEEFAALAWDQKPACVPKYPLTGKAGGRETDSRQGEVKIDGKAEVPVDTAGSAS